VSGLALGLLALAAVLAERGITWSRRGRLRARLLPAVASEPRTIDRRALLAPLAGALAGFALAGWPGGLIGVAAGVGARRLGARHRAATERARHDDQVGDLAAGLAAALRSGMSLTQALAVVRDEAEPPIRDELEVVQRDLDVGIDVDRAFESWVARADTDEARLLGTALSLHRRTGGDLPRVLDQVVATIRERVAIAREVRGLTAQARLSGLILGLLPVAFFGFLWVTSRSDMQAALATPAGIAAVAVGAAMEGAAFLWIRKLLEVG